MEGDCDFIAFDPCYYDEKRWNPTISGVYRRVYDSLVPFTLGTSDSLASLYNAGDTPTVYYYAHQV